jgi:lysophospholipase L1-like esterase
VTPRRWRRAAALAVGASVAAAGLAACGSEGDASATPPDTTVTASTSTSSSTTAPDGGGEPDGPTDDPGPRRVMVLGDSLAAGALEATDLVDQLHDAGFDLVEVLAEQGEGLEWGLEVIEARAAVPEVVVVELGTNPSGDPTGFGPQVRTLLRLLRARGAEHIAWLTPAHRDEDRYEEKIAILRRVGDIDLLADWAAEAEANPDELVADGLHPSSEGYAELAEFLVDTALEVEAER